MNKTEDTNQRQSVIDTNQVLWLPILFSFGALMSLGWMDNARGPIYPLIIESLGINFFEGGWFFAVASFSAVISNFSVPFLLRSLSAIKVLLLGIILLMGFPLSLSFVNSYYSLLACAVIFGVALGIVGVTQNIVIEESVPPHKKRSFLSLLHSTYGLAALLAPVSMDFILKAEVDWKNSFLYSLVFVIPIFFLGCLSIFKEKPICQAEIPQLVLPQNIKSKNLLFFWGFLLAFYVSSELFFTTRLVVFYKQVLGFEFYSANSRLALFFVGLFIGRLLSSLLPNNFKEKTVLLMSFIFSISWLILSLKFYPEYIWFIGFLMSPIFPVALSEISNQAGESFKRVSSLCIAISSFGVVMMHIFAGYIADQYGLAAAVYLPLVLLLAGVLMMIFLWPKKQILKA